MTNWLMNETSQTALQGPRSGNGAVQPEQQEYLTKLRGIRIVSLTSYTGSGGIKYSWELSSKGKSLLQSSEELAQLWQEGKLKELYEEIQRRESAFN